MAKVVSDDLLGLYADVWLQLSILPQANMESHIAPLHGQ